MLSLTLVLLPDCKNITITNYVFHFLHYHSELVALTNYNHLSFFMLSFRAWAEDEAKRAREQAKALEEARYRWEKHGIKVVVGSSLDEESSTGVTWLTAGKQVSSVEGTVNRAENLVDKLKLMADNVKGKSREVIDKIIQKVQVLISILREWVAKAYAQTKELKEATISKTRGSIQELQQNTTEFSFAIKEKARGSMQELRQHTADFSLAVKESTKRVAEDCREGVEKLTQKFKS